MTIADALLAISTGDVHAGRDLAEAAAKRAPDNLLALALATYLATAQRSGVYAEPAAFEQFIDGGTNPELYARTIDHLTTLHAQREPRTVLDIGCGDGRVTAAVVGGWTESVDLVEPSEAMLGEATRRLGSTGPAVEPHSVEIAQFLDGPGRDSRWDIAHSTFALHALDPVGRSTVLRSLAQRAQFIAIVEFDVPPFDDRSEEHAAYVAERYAVGVREYATVPQVVGGFLMPVLVGQFDPNQPRHTFEQPVDLWVEQLEACGWRIAKAAGICDYWWAPAVCIEATPA